MDVDYYFTPHSPWSYLGHQRFGDIARRHGAAIRVMPVDIGGKVFPVSGGLPLGKRAPQRQAYRLVELRRFSQFLDIPIHLEPRHFPGSPHEASRLIIAVDLEDGTDAAMRVAGAAMRALWAEERDIADAATLASLLVEQGLPPARLEASLSPAVQERYERNTARAIEAGVFGAPSYVIQGEIFWGQDRLDFVERRLARQP